MTAIADLFPADAPAGVDPVAHTAAVLAKARSSFALGMRSLPAPRRNAMFALYAFSRTIDDIADEPGARDDKLAALSAWRGEIDAVYDGHPRSLTGRALSTPVERFGLPREEFHLMIDGMEMDVRGPVVAPPLATLFAYTRRVAGTVGCLSVRIFGAPDVPERDPFALALADAFQLTNILRDVETDAADGRLYLPAEMLAAHGVPPQPQAAARHPSLTGVCRALGAVARERFAAARDHLGRLDKRLLRPALMMMGVYEGYLDRMERHGFARTPAALSMPALEKVARSLRYGFALPERSKPAATAH